MSEAAALLAGTTDLLARAVATARTTETVRPVADLGTSTHFPARALAIPRPTPRSRAVTSTDDGMEPSAPLEVVNAHVTDGVVSGDSQQVAVAFTGNDDSVADGLAA